MQAIQTFQELNFIEHLHLVRYISLLVGYQAMAQKKCVLILMAILWLDTLQPQLVQIET